MKERIQKVLSQEGIASRRKIEALIREGRVEINGEKAILGNLISLKDTIKIDGDKVVISESKSSRRVLMYHKKVGEISSRKDTKDRRTIFDPLPQLVQGRWISVGRLDINTSGLILFSNDGEFTNKLMHPSSRIEREYIARVQGKVEESHLKKMMEGVKLEDGAARFSDIVPGRKGKTNQWFAMVILEGRSREVRRIWQSQGFNISRLKRVRFGGLFLPKNLRQGFYKELSLREIQCIDNEKIL